MTNFAIKFIENVKNILKMKKKKTHEVFKKGIKLFLMQQDVKETSKIQKKNKNKNKKTIRW